MCDGSERLSGIRCQQTKTIPEIEDWVVMENYGQILILIVKRVEDILKLIKFFINHDIFDYVKIMLVVSINHIRNWLPVQRECLFSKLFAS